MDPTFAPQLPLRRVPKRIVRACVLELLEVVGVLARVGGVLFEGLARPIRKRLVAVVVFAQVTENVAHLAPGHELVEEGLGLGARTPPTLTLARGNLLNAVQGPVLALEQARNDLVSRNVTEVEVGREPARNLLFGLVPIFVVARQLGVQERAQNLRSLLCSAAVIDRRYFVIDRKRGEQALEVRAELFLAHRLPALENLRRDLGPRDRFRATQRVRLGKRVQVFGQVLVQEAAEGERRREDLWRGGERDQTVPVNGFQPHIQLLGSRAHHAGQEEAGEVIGDHQGGLLGESLEKALALSLGALDVGVIRHPRLVEGRLLVGHALDHEGVQAVACPTVVGSQRLQDQERLAQSLRLGCRVLQPEVPPGASGRDHPIEDVVAFAVVGRVLPKHSVLGDAGHRRFSPKGHSEGRLRGSTRIVGRRLTGS